ncbi:hypothetical protein M5K25_012182 [Dendrobium thyrsiflorum]|uniref:Uncharacterized protein n=1 Tax=Dendrobium thyrsiflorum TaxID=117978 RepID=A0ABD0UXB6_DENTH
MRGSSAASATRGCSEIVNDCVPTILRAPSSLFFLLPLLFLLFPSRLQLPTLSYREVLPIMATALVSLWSCRREISNPSIFFFFPQGCGLGKVLLISYRTCRMHSANFENNDVLIV